jgi:Gas vesicle synthesis protein GvpO
MEPEPGEGLDAFLRRAAQVAALGAAVGAAVGAARAARAENGDDGERDSSEREEENDQRAQLQEQEEPPAGQEPVPEQEEEPEQHHLQRAQDQEAPDEQPEEDESGPDEPRGDSPDGQITGEAGSVIRRALTQLEQLTGREPEGVLGLRRDDEGWRVTVEVVELPRVPSSTDVLATYDVVLDDDGDVREYRRTGRYIRGRGDPSE